MGYAIHQGKKYQYSWIGQVRRYEEIHFTPSTASKYLWIGEIHSMLSFGQH